MEFVCEVVFVTLWGEKMHRPQQNEKNKYQGRFVCIILYKVVAMNGDASTRLCRIELWHNSATILLFA